jgi:hypothetical protein
MMPVPETTMNKNNFPTAGKDNVRTARQIALVQPVPISSRVQEAAHEEFRPGVLALDRLHGAAPERG